MRQKSILIHFYLLGRVVYYLTTKTLKYHYIHAKNKKLYFCRCKAYKEKSNYVFLYSLKFSRIYLKSLYFYFTANATPFQEWRGKPI